MVCGRRRSLKVSSLHSRVDDFRSVVELVEEPFLSDGLAAGRLRIS